MLQTIQMRPPNLKIWAERACTVEDGLTSGQNREYIICNEGAALNSDNKVLVLTERLDRDGSPLPESLEDSG